MRKGVEGLPIKYLIIALVGSLVIATALQLTSTIQSSVLSSGELLSNQISGRIVESTLGDTYTSFVDSSVGVFGWSFDLGRSNSELELFLRNVEDFNLNITSVTAFLGGEDETESFGSGLILVPGSSSPKLGFNLFKTTNNNKNLLEGDQISILVKVYYNEGSFDQGSLVGFVVDSSS